MSKKTSIMEEVARSASVAGPSEDSRLTPAERSALEESLQTDEEDLKKAEQEVKALPRGHHVFKCPDASCTFQTIGPRNGPAEKSFKQHVKRHAHARVKMPKHNW